MSGLSSGFFWIMSGGRVSLIHFRSRRGGEEEVAHGLSRSTSLPLVLAEINANIGERGGHCRLPRGEGWCSLSSPRGEEGVSLRKLGTLTIPLWAGGWKSEKENQSLASEGS